MPSPTQCQILLVNDDPSVRESVAMTLMAVTMSSLQRRDSASSPR
jgi:hypothetical protein